MENSVEKRPFDIDEMVARVRKAVEPFPKAAMFELAEQGYSSPFEMLVACMISIRTLDEVMLPTARRLFAVARTPQAIAALPVSEIERLIRTSSFHERKAVQIQALAQRVAAEYGGQLPCDMDLLQSFSGVGPKCAKLTLGIACGQMWVSADVHVHRVTNRWGYIHTTAPEKTSLELEARLPQRYHVEINSLLVPFGKHICTGNMPRCSICPVLEFCRQVGVTAHR